MATPQLRFKEFNESWSLTSFQDLFTFKNGVNASKEQYGSGIKFINVLDIINNPNGITYESIIGSVDITSKEIEKNLVQYGDVLFQRSSETREEVGQSNVYLSNEPVVFGGFIIRGSAQKDYDPIFMNGLLKTDSLRDQITQLSGGSTRFNIGQDSLNKVSAYLPSKEEQTKIASFLSAVDEKISQLTQKHELLSQYKQGMIQKLFSQQIRFKADDGSEFGEWDNLKFRDVITIKYGKDHKALKEGNIPVLGTGGIMRYVDSYLYDGESILIGRKGTIDKPQFISGKFWTVDTLFYTEIGERLIPKFAYQQLLLVNWLNLNEATGVPSLNTTSIGNIEVKIPCLEEQTKIANFLSAIDQKIEVVAQQIEQAKQWKKGLLQQMFV